MTPLGRDREIDPRLVSPAASSTVGGLARCASGLPRSSTPEAIRSRGRGKRRADTRRSRRSALYAAGDHAVPDRVRSPPRRRSHHADQRRPACRRRRRSGPRSTAGRDLRIRLGMRGLRDLEPGLDRRSRMREVSLTRAVGGDRASANSPAAAVDVPGDSAKRPARSSGSAEYRHTWRGRRDLQRGCQRLTVTMTRRRPCSRARRAVAAGSRCRRWRGGWSPGEVPQRGGPAASACRTVPSPGDGADLVRSGTATVGGCRRSGADHRLCREQIDVDDMLGGRRAEIVGASRTGMICRGSSQEPGTRSPRAGTGSRRRRSRDAHRSRRSTSGAVRVRARWPRRTDPGALVHRTTPSITPPGTSAKTATPRQGPTST